MSWLSPLRVTTMDAKDLRRLSKQGWNYATGETVHAEAGSHERLVGQISEQNLRSRNLRDVIDIGSGTRCKHCGMLHFCYLERCGACSKPIEYNLGKVDVKV